MADRKWRERKQRMENYERKQFERRHHSVCVACHEAGHYVVASVLGYAAFASIVPNERNEARTNVCTPSTRAGLLDQVAINMAGEMAIMMLLGQSGLIVLNSADLAIVLASSWMVTMLDRDIRVQMVTRTMARVVKFYQNNLDRVPEFVYEEAGKLMKAAQPKTTEILEQHWAEIDEVTDGLLKYKAIANEKMMSMFRAQDTETISGRLGNCAAVAVDGGNHARQ